jgi:hypothetical protein
MPCVLTSGFTIPDCLDGVGGISLLRVAKLQDVATITEAAGVVTAITMVATKKFWKYELKKETTSVTETENVSDENGSTFYEQSVDTMLHKLSATKRNELRLLALSNLVVIATLNDGQHILLGKKYGLNKSGSAESGKGLGDFNGYKMMLKGKEIEPAPFVTDAILAAITN